jgi:hypothetical protein
MKRGRPLRIARWLDHNFHILAERDKKPKQALD